MDQQTGIKPKIQRQVGQSSASEDTNTEKKVIRRVAMRRLIDKFATKVIGLGGLSVIFAVSLIFIFLLGQVIPLFTSAGVDHVSTIRLSGQEQVLWSDLDERGEVISAARQTDQGISLSLYKLPLGEDVYPAAIANLEAFDRLDLGIPQAAHWSFDPSNGWFASQSDGKAYIGRIKEKEVFEKGKERSIKTELKLISPEGGFDLNLDSEIKNISLRAAGKTIALTVVDELGGIFIYSWKEKSSFITNETTFSESTSWSLGSNYVPENVMIDSRLRWAYVVSQQNLELFSLKSKDGETILPYDSVNYDYEISASSLLLGTKSLLIGDVKGNVQQWTLVRNEENRSRLTSLRTIAFNDSPIVNIFPEERRRGFYAIDASGQAGIFFTTSNRKLADWQVPDEFNPASSLVSSARSNRLLVPYDDQYQVYNVKNDHPEVSWASLWGKVWYEGYKSPEYIWQSSSSTNEFEPKFSLAPLAYGTLKATFYAILFALPLAICGAIYTAYFMAPAVRKKVKPCIEFMEALPTVILGFLAGIWLAPLVEKYLPGVLLVLLALPLSIFFASFAWTKFPKRIRALLPDGWEPLILIPVVIAVVGLCFGFSMPLENLLFDGDARIWMRENFGISYDQRNSLVVGIAMGFAVIPTIFSIAEDAVFAVPKSLSYGSLALGASPWQTLVRVVLPTASPGIFSAVMIGTGRAIGETMIVLMATGSTPIMDMNIFEGFRTLSANIAIEMPEAEVHSTHYRLLFLAAFCLFLFTFIFNTTAEIVRQRLREKYGSL